MPRNVIPEASWDSELKQSLISYYRDLVQTEVNEPIPLRSTFLGIKLSEKMADELASANRLIHSLGSHGIFEDGIPFYHLHTQTLSKEELRRLDTNLVRLKTGKFSESEDDQIRRNWQTYCEISGTDPDEAPLYMGCSTDRQKKKGSHYFRAWMCRGLPDRTGIQVYRRAQTIFHPSNENGGFSRPWTKAELDILLELGPTGKWAEIGAKLNRPRYHCQKAYIAATQEGLNVDNEDDKDMNLLYKYVTKAIGEDPVKAFANGHLNELQQLIDWEQIGQLLSREPENCRELFKTITDDMEEIQSIAPDANVDKLIKKITQNLPQACRGLCRVQNKKKPKLALTPKQFSAHIRDLCNLHHDEILTLPRPYRFRKTFIASEALSEYDEKARISILRRLTYVVSTFQEFGIFDFLPAEHRDLLTKLNLVRYVMKKISSSRVKSAEAFVAAKRFIEKQGWEARRNVHAYKLTKQVKKPSFPLKK